MLLIDRAISFRALPDVFLSNGKGEANAEVLQWISEVLVIANKLEQTSEIVQETLNSMSIENDTVFSQLEVLKSHICEVCDRSCNRLKNLLDYSYDANRKPIDKAKIDI